METLFFNVLNMSITAGYVILAVLFIRLLLKRAPKRFSCLLWSVVLFRLVCPVSFSSVYSIFQAGPFDMTIAQKDSPAVLRYIPANIGYTETPKLTTGIPYMNTLVNGSLSPSSPYTGINSPRVWIRFAMILWCLGIAALLIISITNYIRLKRRMAAAVKLNGQVFESDKIRSPFILGLVYPRIYIPFGLSSQELTCILKHENCHIKRKDHLVKALSYCVMVFHWFNPLVWIAFSCMAKDMEMSCDEKVLSESGTGIIREYSTSLLSFAANRRFPAANPLAFGETAVRERIRNVLRFRKPSKWIFFPAALICIIAVALCAANPKGKSGQTVNTDFLYGDYVFEKQIYMNPLSSTLALDGYKEYYTLTKDSLTITAENGSRQTFPAVYQQSLLSEEEFKNSFIVDIAGIPDLSRYKEKIRYSLTSGEESFNYHIYLLDQDIWFVKVRAFPNNSSKSPYIWSIYRISRLNKTGL